MSDFDELNDLDDIEDEDFKDKKIKKEKSKTPDKKNEKEEEVTNENIFVTNNPTKSTSYKDKLLKVYAELEAITDEEIQVEIDELKKQILDLLQIKNESDEKIRAFASKEINNKLEAEKDLHYLPRTKPNVISKAKDTPIFTLTNVLLVLCFIGLCITSLLLLIKL